MNQKIFQLESSCPNYHQRWSGIFWHTVYFAVLHQRTHC